MARPFVIGLLTLGLPELALPPARCEMRT